MGVTTNAGLPYPPLTNAPNVPSDIQSLAQTIDTLLGPQTLSGSLTLATGGVPIILGTGGIDSVQYFIMGKLLKCWFSITLGTTGLSITGHGGMTLSVPVAAISTAAGEIGTARIFDHSSGNAYTDVSIIPNSTTTVSFQYSITYGGTLTAVSDTAPWTWAAQDIISGYFECPLP